MTVQYLRKVRATFNGGFTINPGGIMPVELMISFDVSKSISSSANTASIDIYNLTESHRNAMGKEFDEVMLEAGYMPPAGFSGPGILNFSRGVNGIYSMSTGQVSTGSSGNVGIIFKGNIRDVAHKRQGENIVTTISCGDGDKALRKGVTNKSYPKGTPVKTVVEDIYKGLEKEGVTRGEWKFPDDMEPNFKRPYVACGSCAREMNTLGRGKQFYWSIQNGAMEIIPGDGFIGMVALISPKTGMIDTPTITDNGIRVSTLLNPEIRPGRRVKVESSIIDLNATDGIYRVSECTFSGDNRDGDFRVAVTGEAVQGTKVDEGRKG